MTKQTSLLNQGLGDSNWKKRKMVKMDWFFFFSFKMVMGLDWHEHGSILHESTLSTSIFMGDHRNHRTSGPQPVTTPCKLYIYSCPCSPIRRIVSRRSFKSFIGKFVSEVVCDVLKIFRVKAEGLSWFDADECGRRGRKPVSKRPAEAPWEELVTEEATWLEHARGYHAFAEVLVTFYASPYYEYHSWDRVSFSYYLL